MFGKKRRQQKTVSDLIRFKKTRILWWILAVSLLALVLVAVLAGIDHEVEAVQIAQSESQSELIRESEEAQSIAESLLAAETATETETEKETQDPFFNYVSPIDFETLWKQNKDIVAWLSIPGTNIEYPILQSKDDDAFYLNHNVDRQEDKNGALYIERQYNKDDFSDPVTVVYGHNMASGKMFGFLQETYSQGFDGHAEAIVYLPDRERHYQLFSALPIGAGHLLYDKDMSDEVTYAKFATKLLNSDDFDATISGDTQITVGERLLVLSTCIGQQPDKRYIVVGKEVGPSAREMGEDAISLDKINLGLLFSELILLQETETETETESGADNSGKRVIQQYSKVESNDNSHAREEDKFVWTPEPDSDELGGGDVMSPKTSQR